jgi:hypothetical protein
LAWRPRGWQASAWWARSPPAATRPVARARARARPARHPGALARARPAAQREVSSPLVPCRPATACPAVAGNARASALAPTGAGSASRRGSLGGRARPDHGLAGRGPVPGGHIEACGWMPTP